MIATFPEVALRPTLINVKLVHGQHLKAGLFVSPDLPYFSGHFPGFPILPGVTQLDWAVYYARDFLLIDNPVKHIERLKFTCPIVPNIQLLLNLDYDSHKSAVDFRFYKLLDDTNEQTFSMGRIVYVMENSDE